MSESEKALIMPQLQSKFAIIQAISESGFLPAIPGTKINRGFRCVKCNYASKCQDTIKHLRGCSWSEADLISSKFQNLGISRNRHLQFGVYEEGDLIELPDQVHLPPNAEASQVQELAEEVGVEVEEVVVEEVVVVKPRKKVKVWGLR